MKHVAVAVALVVVACSSARAEGGTSRTARAMSSLLTASLAEGARYEVITEADLRGAVKLEVEKELAGGCDDEDCMSEIAGALGTRYVVLSQLDVVGETLVLHLTLFDNEETRVIERVGVTGESEDELADGLRAATHGFARALEEVGAERVLVLDARAPPPPDADYTLAVVGAATTIASGALLGITWFLTAAVYSAAWLGMRPSVPTRDLMLLNLVPVVGPFIAVPATEGRFAAPLSLASGVGQTVFAVGVGVGGALWLMNREGEGE